MYLNPTFKEVVDLKSSNPDTIRVIVSESGDFAVADGYGATHTCIRRKLRISGDELILERSGVIWFVGADDEQVSASEFGDRFSEFVADFMSL